VALIHTCYRITDIDRSVAFYEALGFQEVGRLPIRDEAVNVFMNQHAVGHDHNATGRNEVRELRAPLDHPARWSRARADRRLQHQGSRRAPHASRDRTR
jgi:catechol 2,3-dioxygenase-like lactoylglutathione lyase family enzyme